MTMPPTTRRELLTPIRQRWTWLHKFWICHGIQHGVITMDEAMRVHKISNEEVVGWYHTYTTDGAHGFRRQNIGPRTYAA